MIIFAFLLAVNSGQANMETWTACKKDSDCVKRRNVCGSAASINIKYETVFKEYVRELATRSSCLQPSLADKKRFNRTVSHCIKNFCKSIDPEKTAH